MDMHVIPKQMTVGELMELLKEVPEEYSVDLLVYNGDNCPRGEPLEYLFTPTKKEKEEGKDYIVLQGGKPE